MSSEREAVHRGYIISNRGWPAQTQLEMGASSFGRTAGEAWRRHIRMDGRAQRDFSLFVQRWSDKGYGPVAVEIRPLPHDKEAEG